MATATIPAMALGGVPRVNLMPRAETERRARNALIGKWAVGIIGALAVVVLAVGAAFYLQFAAAQRLVAENSKTNALLTELASLADVRSQLSLESELQTYRAEAMASDLKWTGVLGLVQSILPEGVTPSAFTLTPGAAPQGEDPTLETGVTGTLTLTSPAAADIVPLVRALRALPAVIDADGWQGSVGEGGFTYEVRLTLDQSVYTGAYAEAVTE
jgi:hypothetical protein